MTRSGLAAGNQPVNAVEPEGPAARSPVLQEAAEQRLRADEPHDRRDLAKHVGAPRLPGVLDRHAEPHVGGTDAERLATSSWKRSLIEFTKTTRGLRHRNGWSSLSGCSTRLCVAFSGVHGLNSGYALVPANRFEIVSA